VCRMLATLSRNESVFRIMWIETVEDGGGGGGGDCGTDL
jgi:hypothetical protein